MKKNKPNENQEVNCANTNNWPMNCNRLVERLFLPLNTDQRQTLIIITFLRSAAAATTRRLIPSPSAESNLKVANENMNIIKATLKNIIDLYVVVWVDMEATF